MAGKLPVDPICRFNQWLLNARQAGNPKAEAGALATSDGPGRPSVRFVLLKQADSRGFVFFTDTRSEKGRELRENPFASLAFYWDETTRQVRISGPVEAVTESEADAYWATRPRESQLSASVSRQSAELKDRARLVAAVKKARQSFARREIPRPGYWSGYRLVPERIEFWTQGAHRLHRRELFVKHGTRWARVLLQP